MAYLNPKTGATIGYQETKGTTAEPFNVPMVWQSSTLSYVNLLADANGNLLVSGGITGTFNENLAQVGGVGYSLGQKTMAGSMPVNIASDQSNVPISIKTAGNVVDPLNSTNTPLLAGGVFTGAWVNVLNYNQLEVMAFSDQAGTITIQYSIDGITVVHSHVYIVLANEGETTHPPTHGNFYRVVYTNGAVNQTVFQLQTVLCPVAGVGSVIEVDNEPTAQDDALLTKSIITAKSSLSPFNYVDVKSSPDGALFINQNIQIDATNSSTANLAVGATFTGTTQSNITATQIQVLLKADQNCTVFVDQSSNGILFEVTDQYRYFHARPNFAINVNAVGAFYRVRVTNVGIATTTQFSLQSIVVPILETLPRSLSPDGWLQVAVNHHEDDNGSVQYFTPFGENLAVPIYHLTGAVFNGSTLDTTAWNAVTGTGGVVTPTNGLLELTTGTTANNAVSIQSHFTGRFVSGCPHQARFSLRLGDTGTLNNIRRWGCFSTTDGVFFELNGTTFSICVMKAGVITRISNGSFNGVIGNTIAVDTNGHFYQIVYTPANVMFLYDNELLHKQPFLQTSWTSTLDLPVRLDNTNSGGLATSLSMYTSVATLLREGLPDSQPISIFQSGTTAGIVCKVGSGNVRKITLSSVVNNAVVTLYDNTAASGTIIWSSGALGAQTNPSTFDLDRGPFNIGLTLVVSGAAANVYLTFE